MNSDELREISERDQLWASLHSIRGEIDRIAAGSFDGSGQQQHLLALLARIVAAELDFRRKDSTAES